MFIDEPKHGSGFTDESPSGGSGAFDVMTFDHALFDQVFGGTPFTDEVPHGSGLSNESVSGLAARYGIGRFGISHYGQRSGTGFSNETKDPDSNSNESKH